MLNNETAALSLVCLVFEQLSINWLFLPLKSSKTDELSQTEVKLSGPLCNNCTWVTASATALP